MTCKMQKTKQWTTEVCRWVYTNMFEAQTWVLEIIFVKKPVDSPGCNFVIYEHLQQKKQNKKQKEEEGGKKVCLLALDPYLLTN